MLLCLLRIWPSKLLAKSSKTMHVHPFQTFEDSFTVLLRVDAARFKCSYE